MAVFVCLHIITLPHYNNYVDVAEGIGTLECVSGAFWQVCKIKSIFSILFHAIYRAMCIQLTHLSYDDFANVYLILLSPSSRKYESFAIV